MPSISVVAPVSQRPPVSLATCRRAWSHTVSESISTPSRSKITAASARAEVTRRSSPVWVVEVLPPWRQRARPRCLSSGRQRGEVEGEHVVPARPVAGGLRAAAWPFDSRRAAEPSGELGVRPVLKHAVDVDVDLLVVEGDQAGDLLALGQRHPIGPGQVPMNAVAGAHRPPFRLALVGAVAHALGWRQ